MGGAKALPKAVAAAPSALPLLRLPQMSPVQRAAGEVPGIAHHLAGLGRPLCCDYDGNTIIMGCEDGTVRGRGGGQGGGAGGRGGEG